MDVNVENEVPPEGSPEIGGRRGGEDCSPVSVAAARGDAQAQRQGEARRERGLAIAAQRHSLDALRLQRKLLLVIRDRGVATTDDLEDDLCSLHRDGAWRGAAVRKLAAAEVIRAAGMARCKRLRRRGSPIMRWVAVDPDAVAAKLQDLEQLIAAAESESERKIQKLLPIGGAT